MRHKWGRTVPAVLLAIAMAIGTFAHHTVVDASINLSNKCSLTINTGTEEELGLDSSTVAVDLYKVANAVETPGYNTYEYSEIAAYTSLMEDLSDTSKLDAAKWRELAQKAAEITFMKGQTIQLAASGVAGEAISELDCGLYLVVAHGADLDEYVETITDEEGNTNIVTIANSKRYKFSFAPELISLPVTTTEEITADIIMNTADASRPGADWVYDAKARLKYSYVNRFGDLEIIKHLEVKEGTLNPLFVFDIKAELDGEVVYSDVASLQFDDGDMTKSCLVADKIPVGAKVTVTEIYTGQIYKLVSGDKTQTVEIPDPKDGDRAVVRYSNTFEEGPPSPNGGITNKFSNGEEGWTLDNNGDNSTNLAK